MGRNDHEAPRSTPADIAVIGMACMMPRAPDLETFWNNIVNKVDAVSEVPENRWDWRLYYDPDHRTRDKVNSRWGGFVDAVPFDPAFYGIPPQSLPFIETLHLLTLETVRSALRDAGCEDRPFPRERTSMIMGLCNCTPELAQRYIVRSQLPLLFDEVPPEILDRYPEWTPDSFPGFLGNVTAGRVASCFDLGGVNYAVDAACASSLAAVNLAVRDLEAGTSDMVIVGGGDTIQSPWGYLSFGKIQALSPTGRVRAFDRSADGTVISEGVAALVLKRRVDAERNGDRIYALIRAVEGSSDGKGRAVTAPRPSGQKLALERAYARAGISPSTMGLIEAHGTGTLISDRAETESLRQVFGTDDDLPPHCAVGTVKSMIGHTKAAAGVAGMIKAVLAIHHKVLPPTLGVTRPVRALREGPLFVNTELRPWFERADRLPRRAGVTAFGFGGSNFHGILEEYSEQTADQRSLLRTWPAELLVFAAPSREELALSLASLREALKKGATPALSDLAFTLWKHASRRGRARLAVTAASLDDLMEKIPRALSLLRKERRCAGIQPGALEERGVFLDNDVSGEMVGKVAFLFPGRESVYRDMLQDLAAYFPEVREKFEAAERAVSGRQSRSLCLSLFPPSCSHGKGEENRRETLEERSIARTAAAAANLGLLSLMNAFGVAPDKTAGFDIGELAALSAAGDTSGDALFKPGDGSRGAVRLPADSSPDAISREIEKMFESGARIFVEAGPGTRLSDLTGKVLAGRPHTAVSLDAPGRSCIEHLLHVLAGLMTSGLPVRLDRLFEGRELREVDLDNLLEEGGASSRDPAAWMVDGGRVWQPGGGRQSGPGSSSRQAAAAASPATRQRSGSADRSQPTPEAFMIRHQQLMRRFVRQQHDVMRDYLEGADVDREAVRSAFIDLARSAGDLLLDPPEESGKEAARPAPASPLPTGENLEGQVLSLVSELTGYPVEILDIDARMEADLGIDSLKRIEILGALRERLLPGGALPGGSVQEFFQDMTTFRHLVEKVAGILRADEGEDAADGEAGENGTVSRFVVTPVEAPLPGSPPLVFPRDSVFLIIDDEGGLAPVLADRLRESGGRAVLVRRGGVAGEKSPDSFTVDPVDPDSVAALFSMIRKRHGPICGLIHLLSLLEPPSIGEIDLDQWQDHLRGEVKSLFLMAAAAADDLRQAAAAGAGWLLAATAMGNCFAVEGNGSASFSPGSGGVAGLVKSLAQEWPAVRCKVVDLELEAPLQARADALLREMAGGDNDVEVAFTPKGRFVLRMRHEPAAASGSGQPVLHSDSVVLVTGGARGITASVARDLARRYRPKLLLVGRSPLPDEEEPPAFAEIDCPEELKKAVAEELIKEKGKATPAEVRAACSRILRRREMRENVRAMRQAGAEVTYHQVDVSSEKDFGGCIDSIYDRYNRIDLVLHGAGVVEDREIDQKKPDSFDTVFDPKTRGAFILAMKLRSESLKGLVFFSSLAARWGNRGQADYAAANEVLNKLAVLLDSRWACRVVSINWGPWAEIGMVSAEKAAIFEERGIRLVQPADGCRFVDREIRSGLKGQVEVVICGGPRLTEYIV